MLIIPLNQIKVKGLSLIKPDTLLICFILCDNGFGDYMKKYLIVCDLDGTLLNEKSEISIETETYLKKLKSDGHKIVIATGRPFRGCYHYYSQLELDTPIITDNGGAIENPTDPKFKKIAVRIPKRVVDKVFDFSEPNIVTAFYSVENGLYVYKPTERLNWLYHQNEDTFFVEGPFTKAGLPEPSGMMFIVKSSFKEAFQSFIDNETEGLLTFRDWGSDAKNAIFEVYQKRTSKSEAMSLVRQHLNIDSTNVIAFGDGANDIDMIELAHHGVAMVNGIMDLKAISNDITTKPNTENGVIDYLKSYLKE